MAGDKAEMPETRKKELEAKKADAVARLRRGTSRLKHQRRGSPTVAETPSLSEEMAGIPDWLCIPERPHTRKSNQQLNPGL